MHDISPLASDVSQQLTVIVDRANVGIFVIDRQRKVVLWNQFMEVHSQRKASSVIGHDLFDAFPELPQKWLDRKIENVLILKNFSFSSWEQRPYLFKFAHNRPVTGGIDYMRQDCTLMPVKDDSGEVAFVSFTLVDVTNTSIYQSQLEATSQTLREMSNRDGLTQLFNRRYIEKSLHIEYERARRHQHELSVILLDIDHFKRVNDHHGHLAGDHALCEVAQRLQQALRGSDILARYGGEEFLVILPETDTEGTLILAERLRAAINDTPITLEHDTLSISISLGIAELNAQTQNPTQLVAEADHGLYQSKDNGRNCITCYTP
jgi:diguanylate cyclase (GGDEF)-like protein